MNKKLLVRRIDEDFEILIEEQVEIAAEIGVNTRFH